MSSKCWTLVGGAVAYLIVAAHSSMLQAAPWLYWLGPWNATLLVGQYEKDRAVLRAKLIGMRFRFSPVAGLDVGLSRAIMVDGEERSESASTIAEAQIGRDNSQDGADNDPGNQLGSVDIRYGFSVGQQSIGGVCGNDGLRRSRCPPRP